MMDYEIIDHTHYDFIGIGIGPFNLGLACLSNTIKEIKSLFLDAKPEFNWHTGMMIQESHLQTPFMSDLVTMADPTHPLSFLNYLKQKGELYRFYIRENFFLPRQQYNQYCQWAIEQIKNVQFSRQVINIQYIESKKVYSIIAKHDGATYRYYTKKLVLGTGTVPYVPPCCDEQLDRVVHSSNYLSSKEYLQTQSSITLVGSGQSAAEIFYDLLQDIDQFDYQLHWYTRSSRFFPLEYTKLTLEMTSPEYIDYFYALPSSKRNDINTQQKNLFKGINSELINNIFDLLYTKQINGDVRASLMTNTNLKGVSWEKRSGFQLCWVQHEQLETFQTQADALVLATGYRYALPHFIEGIRHRIRWDNAKRFDVGRFYDIDILGNEIFVQNAEYHSHGFTAPDLGMACYRNSCILRAMTGKTYYPIEERIAFQRFGVQHSKNTEKVMAYDG